MSPFSRLVALVLTAGIMLSGCGFHLRGSGPLLAGDWALEGLPVGDAFAGEFDRALLGAGGHKPVSVTKADGVIHVYRLLRLRRPITLGRFGRANEFDLAFRLVYDIRDAKGETISPRQEIELHRDYFNDQSQPIAQDEEELQIRAEMLREIAQTLIRRVTYILDGKPAAKS